MNRRGLLKMMGLAPLLVAAAEMLPKAEGADVVRVGDADSGFTLVGPDWSFGPYWVDDEQTGSSNASSRTYEWVEDDLHPIEAELQYDLLNEMFMDRPLFSPNDVLLVDSELVLVTSVNPESCQVSAVRGFGGSTACRHAKGAPVTLVGYNTVKDFPTHYFQAYDEPGRG